MNHEKCKGGLVKSETLPECYSEQMTPSGISTSVVAKLPVVLAEPVVQIDVEALIELEEPAIEIKRVKKNLFITQCKVVSIGCEDSGKLFLSGFVRKNIEYATAGCHTHEGKAISGQIKHTTVEVPFRCVTKVHFITPPKFHYQQPSREASLFFEEKKGKNCCEEPIMGSNPCEQSFENFEYFNEEIFCELEEAKFYELDIHKKEKCELRDNDQHDEKEFYDRKEFCDGKDFNGKFVFNKIVEKMVINVRLKLLQKQQVSIKDNCSHGKDMKKKQEW